MYFKKSEKKKRSFSSLTFLVIEKSTAVRELTPFALIIIVALEVLTATDLLELVLMCPWSFFEFSFCVKNRSQCCILDSGWTLHEDISHSAYPSRSRPDTPRQWTTERESLFRVPQIHHHSKLNQLTKLLTTKISSKTTLFSVQWGWFLWNWLFTVSFGPKFPRKFWPLTKLAILYCSLSTRRNGKKYVVVRNSFGEHREGFHSSKRFMYSTHLSSLYTQNPPTGLMF